MSDTKSPIARVSDEILLLILELIGASPCTFRRLRNLSSSRRVKLFQGPAVTAFYRKIALTNVPLNRCSLCKGESHYVTREPNLASFLRFLRQRPDLGKLVRSVDLVVDLKIEMDKDPNTKFSWVVDDLFYATTEIMEIVGTIHTGDKWN